ncbi:HesA/MoeB/ThiF family protein [Vibrio caribbeanicus]|uniref:HesA/MoeB/ThiF family protein n=1 Tax=Vibrio caribbeanicus TaxID=701175 RepID=UPI0030D9D4CF
MLSDNQFVRFQRQICLEEIGEGGQKKLKDSTVLIIGCGGLGCAASLYLASAGIGKLVLVDDDLVEISNLHRQIAYMDGEQGVLKVDALSKRLSAINPQIDIRLVKKRMSEEQMRLETMMADIVLDCCDNMPSRQQINRVCHKQNKTLISASAIGWKGQFSVFDFSEISTVGGCFHCLFPFDNIESERRCVDSGVMGPVVGILGNYQALAAIQKLSMDKVYFDSNQLHLFDGLNLRWQSFSRSKVNHCLVCGVTSNEVRGQS